MSSAELRPAGQTPASSTGAESSAATAARFLSRAAASTAPTAVMPAAPSRAAEKPNGERPDVPDLVAVRRGEVPLAQVIAALDDVDAELVRLQTQANVPPAPDRQWVDGWLHRSHLSYWSTLNQVPEKPR